MLKIVLTVLALFVSGAAKAVSPENCPETVRVTFMDMPAPPFVNGSGQRFEESPGYFVGWIKAGIAASGCKVKLLLSRRPIRRAYRELESDEVDFIGTATPTDEHRSAAVFPMLQDGSINVNLSYFASETSLWVRKGEKGFRWNGQSLVGPIGFKVGVASGTMLETIAKENGWPIEPAMSGENSIVMLLKRRTDIGLMPDALAYSYMTNSDAKLEKLDPAVATSYFYLAAGKQFYARYPKYTSAVWRAVCVAGHSEKILESTAMKKSVCK